MYELMIVATTGGAESLLSRVEKYLKEADAVSLKVNKLGKKQLAYPIKKQTEAEYIVLNFEAEGTNLKSITDKLRLEQEDLLRYMVVSAKVFKPSRRKGKKVEEVVKIEKKEIPKVTVVTKLSSATSSAKATDVKKATDGRQVISETRKVTKSERVKELKKQEKRVDAKGKGKVASKPRKK